MSALPQRIGPYEITGKLGEGGMGIVFAANDTRLNRPVALKMILDSGNDEGSRKRFMREAQAAARVTHPNICRLYDIGEVDGRPNPANRFAEAALDLREIAKEVDVDTVLTGTLLRAGTQLRLTTNWWRLRVAR